MRYKVSVIIPCYNILSWKKGEKLLNNAIDSLKKQSIGFDNLEVILIDDCSTDSTFKIIEKTAKEYENIIAISLEENMGQGMARYYGVKKSTSPYIMFLDADDAYSSDSCAKLYETIEEKNADIVNSNYIIKLNGDNYTGFNYDSKYKEFNPNNSLKNFQQQYAVWARIYKKETIENIKNPLRSLEDTYFNFKAFLNSEKIIYLNNFYSCIHSVNYDSFTLKPSIESVNRGFDTISNIIEVVGESDDEISPYVQNMFSMIIQDVLMYNFSYKENKVILKNFKKTKYEVMNKYNVSEEIFNSPLFLKMINIFVEKGMYTLISLMMRPLQFVLSNKRLFKFLFIHVQKHEKYHGKL